MKSCLSGFWRGVRQEGVATMSKSTFDRFCDIQWDDDERKPGSDIATLENADIDEVLGDIIAKDDFSDSEYVLRVIALAVRELFTMAGNQEVLR
jgi:hypothetical protein